MGQQRRINRNRIEFSGSKEGPGKHTKPDFNFLVRKKKNKAARKARIVTTQNR